MITIHEETKFEKKKTRSIHRTQTPQRLGPLTTVFGLFIITISESLYLQQVLRIENKLFLLR